MKIQRAIAVMALIVVAGCAQQPMKPLEPLVVTLPNVDRRKVMEFIVAAHIGRPDITMRSATDFQVVFGKRVRTPLAAALYGSRYDATPEARLTYTMANIGSSVQVNARLEMVTNPGSGYERINDVSRENYAEIRKELDALRSVFAK